jgi:hypothetical protein
MEKDFDAFAPQTLAGDRGNLDGRILFAERADQMRAVEIAGGLADHE